MVTIRKDLLTTTKGRGWSRYSTSLTDSSTARSRGAKILGGNDDPGEQRSLGATAPRCNGIGWEEHFITIFWRACTTSDDEACKGHELTPSDGGVSFVSVRWRLNLVDR